MLQHNRSLMMACPARLLWFEGLTFSLQSQQQCQSSRSVVREKINSLRNISHQCLSSWIKGLFDLHRPKWLGWVSLSVLLMGIFLSWLGICWASNHTIYTWWLAHLPAVRLKGTLATRPNWATAQICRGHESTRFIVCQLVCNNLTKGKSVMQYSTSK